MTMMMMMILLKIVATNQIYFTYTMCLIAAALSHKLKENKINNCKSLFNKVPYKLQYVAYIKYIKSLI